MSTTTAGTVGPTRRIARDIIAVMTFPTLDVQSESIARGVLESLSGDKIVLALPHSDYRVHLTLAGPIGSIPSSGVGKRIKGVIEARALRMFTATGGGGGQFIEPLDGSPRIVAGRVMHVDAPGRRLLVDAAAPMWMSLVEGDDPNKFNVGDMVNCYVESGTRFTPA